MAVVQLPAVDLLTRSRFGPLSVVFIILSAGWYLWSGRQLRRRGGYWSKARTWSFLAGEACYAAGLLSGLHSFAPQNFSAYCTQYILAVLLAPALFAFGAPLRLLLQASEGERRERLSRVLEGRALRVGSNPFLTWLLFVACLCVLFFTGLTRLTLSDPLAEDAVFLAGAASAFLFYLPVVDADALPHRIGTWPRILYLLLVFPVWAIVGMGMESQSRRIVPELSLASLHLGAAVLWVAGESVAILGTIWVLWEWLRRDLEDAKHHDAEHEAAAARQLALWRASRDAAARTS